jgi:hypothetical protein
MAKSAMIGMRIIVSLPLVVLASHIIPFAEKAERVASADFGRRSGGSR